MNQFPVVLIIYLLVAPTTGNGKCATTYPLGDVSISSKFDGSCPSSKFTNLVPYKTSVISPAEVRLFTVVGGRKAVVIIAVTIIFLLKYLRKSRRVILEKKRSRSSARPTRLCRSFSLVEIRAATEDFSHELIVGRGGFGVVYKGILILDNRRATVAVKRLRCDSQQGEREFWTEVTTLSKVQHINVVSLIGYSIEQRELILVYEYMACGTLGDHLYGLDTVDGAHLSWQQRLRICIGAGRGLDYLHTGFGVIHRDIKASNILLDENYMAKIADFGLAKLVNIQDEVQSHLSTNVQGTYGYLDPNYVATRKLTQNSDTYAFGVVLLEVLSGRPALDTRLEDGNHDITAWAREMMRRGKVDQMLDPSLSGKISCKSLKTFMEIVKGCLDGDPKKRPTMAQVVLKLVSALAQQEITGIAAGPCSTNNSEALAMTEKKTDRKHKPTRIRAWSSIWKKVTTSKNKRSADQQSVGSTAPKLQPLQHQKLSKHNKTWQFSQFFYSDLAAATNNFFFMNMFKQKKHVKMYRGVLHNNNKVAIIETDMTLMKDLSRKKMEAFESRLDDLLQVPSHKNLCSLVGICKTSSKILLVHEYMENGSLSDHLHGSKNVRKNGRVTNSWKNRINISVGAARGIGYLHQGMTLPVIHGAIKTSSIFLDENWTVRVGFVLSVSDMGDSFLYEKTSRSLDPEYFVVGSLNEKSDVYSFGVVLLELLTGKRALIWNYDDDGQITFVKYATQAIKAGKVCNILDPGVSPPKFDEARAVEMVAEIAARCVCLDREERPSMSEVFHELAEASAACRHA